ncbi:1687fec2-4a2e-4517-8e26-9240386b6b08 [Sclerotinia trifoliorum]|uniref:1687fec2-4a2e-4517-8e26-9240386b6b08 n=1 Tax=Sclerotinia trifoliorum TaxID=28548 RepID=A0A8H2W009_9HELO|nr:1687fec2-4a2e-4517-8e26-9240386b6b08 [Sclerotinia trifoliorum]
MIPATDIGSPSSEALYHRRSPETWPTGYNEPRGADSEFSKGHLSKTRSFAPSKTKFFFKNFMGISILFLILLNVLQSVLIVSLGSKSLKKCLASPVKIPELSLDRSHTRHISCTSRFTSRNITDGNEAWHKTLPGHGVRALPQSYVEANNLPESTATHLCDGDTEPKHIYFIESYYVLHCLRMLRSLYHSYDYNLRLAPFLPPADHPYHCFDRIRQYIMCNPDYTLVPNIEDMVNQIGRNRIKKCMDWDVLRDWAEKWHGDYMDTFEFSDREKELGGYDEVNIYGNYREGDGLPVGEL